MCVILAGRSSKPTWEVLQKCEGGNDDGAGIGWVNEDGSGVRYRKGLKAWQIRNILAEEVKRDWVIHFRMATAGGKTDEMTHPFPITQGVELAKEGETDELLFHNGHWNSWDVVSDYMARRFNLEKPGGDWSDSRAIAWLAAHGGRKALESIPGKFAVLERGGFVIYPLDKTGWYGECGMWFSNTSWRDSTRASCSRPRLPVQSEAETPAEVAAETDLAAVPDKTEEAAQAIKDAAGCSTASTS